MTDKVTIIGRPEFYVPLCAADVHLLTDLAARHYDAKCREAAERGFIHGWKNEISSWKIAAPSDRTVSATFRELDLCLKVMEMPSGLPPAKARRVCRLRSMLSGALRTSNEVSKAWHHEYEVGA